MDISTIARKLNVSAILESSVGRSGQRIRITAHLNNAVTGFHVWSQTYARNLGDFLKPQAEIANAVASALKVTLLSGALAVAELGGTRSAPAMDAYLRATKAYSSTGRQMRPEVNEAAVLSAYDEAIRTFWKGRWSMRAVQSRWRPT